jgi:putative spermidine/putrescine transport system ATP-binding protein
MARLELKHLSKRYGEFFAVREVDLTVAEGELVVLLGPSGCGKTTTLRMIAGFVEPTLGAVLLGGRNVTHLPPWKRNAGLVFQNYALFPHLTVAQNVAFGLQTRGVSASDIAPRVEEALRLVRLGHLGERLPRQLSGGQQQRVALARALVFRPDVLLLDEPLSNLDAKLRQEVRIEIRELQRALGLTTVMVTHDQDEALTMADRLVVMSEGRVRQVGTQRDLYERPADPFVAGFVGRSSFLHGKLDDPGLFQTGAGLRIRCADGAAGPLPTAVLTLRPERVTVAATPVPDAENCFPGEVEFVCYLGSLIDIHVRLSGTERVIAQIPNRDGGFEPRIGDKVHVSWAAGAAMVFPDHDERLAASDARRPRERAKETMDERA